jgi:predicted O-methyltransferase YrrM
VGKHATLSLRLEGALVPPLRDENDAHPHVPEERADLFRCYDGGSTEVEYLELLAALVRCWKPETVLETGTWNGHGTVAIAQALKTNGLGRLVSVDSNRARVDRVQTRLQSTDLNNTLIVESHSLDYLRATSERFDFAFLDSDLEIRVEELEVCRDRGLLLPNALVAIHDTSRRRTLKNGAPDPASLKFHAALRRFCVAESPKGIIECPYSRGLLLIRP